MRMPRVMLGLIDLPRAIGIGNLLRHGSLHEEPFKLNSLRPFFARRQIRAITFAVGGPQGVTPCNPKSTRR